MSVSPRRSVGDALAFSPEATQQYFGGIDREDAADDLGCTQMYGAEALHEAEDGLQEDASSTAHGLGVANQTETQQYGEAMCDCSSSSPERSGENTDGEQADMQLHPHPREAELSPGRQSVSSVFTERYHGRKSLSLTPASAHRGGSRERDCSVETETYGDSCDESGDCSDKKSDQSRRKTRFYCKKASSPVWDSDCSDPEDANPRRETLLYCRKDQLPPSADGSPDGLSDDSFETTGTNANSESQNSHADNAKLTLPAASEVPALCQASIAPTTATAEPASDTPPRPRLPANTAASRKMSPDADAGVTAALFFDVHATTSSSASASQDATACAAVPDAATAVPDAATALPDAATPPAPADLERPTACSSGSGKLLSVAHAEPEAKCEAQGELKEQLREQPHAQTQVQSEALPQTRNQEARSPAVQVGAWKRKSLRKSLKGRRKPWIMASPEAPSLDDLPPLEVSTVYSCRGREPSSKRLSAAVQPKVEALLRRRSRTPRASPRGFVKLECHTPVVSEYNRACEALFKGRSPASYTARPQVAEEVDDPKARHWRPSLDPPPEAAGEQEVRAAAGATKSKPVFDTFQASVSEVAAIRASPRPRSEDFYGMDTEMGISAEDVVRSMPPVQAKSTACRPELPDFDRPSVRRDRSESPPTPKWLGDVKRARAWSPAVPSLVLPGVGLRMEPPLARSTTQPACSKLHPSAEQDRPYQAPLRAGGDSSAIFGATSPEQLRLQQEIARQRAEAQVAQEAAQAAKTAAEAARARALEEQLKARQCIAEFERQIDESPLASAASIREWEALMQQQLARARFAEDQVGQLERQLASMASRAAQKAGHQSVKGASLLSTITDDEQRDEEDECPLSPNSMHIRSTIKTAQGRHRVKETSFASTIPDDEHRDEDDDSRATEEDAREANRAVGKKVPKYLVEDRDEEPLMTLVKRETVDMDKMSSVSANPVVQAVPSGPQMRRLFKKQSPAQAFMLYPPQQTSNRVNSRQCANRETDIPVEKGLSTMKSDAVKQEKREEAEQRKELEEVEVSDREDEEQECSDQEEEDEEEECGDQRDSTEEGDVEEHLGQGTMEIQVDKETQMDENEELPERARGRQTLQKVRRGGDMKVSTEFVAEVGIGPLHESVRRIDFMEDHSPVLEEMEASGERTAESEGNTSTQDEMMQCPEQQTVEIDESQEQMESALKMAAESEQHTKDSEGNTCTQDEETPCLEQQAVEVDESQEQMESALKVATDSEKRDHLVDFLAPSTWGKATASQSPLPHSSWDMSDNLAKNNVNRPVPSIFSGLPDEQKDDRGKARTSRRNTRASAGTNDANARAIKEAQANSKKQQAQPEWNTCTQEEMTPCPEQQAVEVDESQEQMESALKVAAESEQRTEEPEGNTCTQDEVMQCPEQQAVEVDESQEQMESALKVAAESEQHAEEPEWNTCTQEDMTPCPEQQAVDVDESQEQMESALLKVTTESEGGFDKGEESKQPHKDLVLEVVESQIEMKPGVYRHTMPEQVHQDPETDADTEDEDGEQQDDDEHEESPLAPHVLTPARILSTSSTSNGMHVARQVSPTDLHSASLDSKQSLSPLAAPNHKQVRRISMISVPDDDEEFAEQSEGYVQNEDTCQDEGEEEEDEDVEKDQEEEEQEEKQTTAQKVTLVQVKLEDDEEEQEELLQQQQQQQQQRQRQRQRQRQQQQQQRQPQSQQQQQQPQQQPQQQQQQQQEQHGEEEEEDDDEEEEEVDKDEEQAEKQLQGAVAFAPEPRQLHEPSTPARKSALQALPAARAHLEETPVTAAALPAVTFIPDSLPSQRFEDTPVHPPRASLPPLSLATDSADACPKEALQPPIGVRASLPSVPCAPEAYANSGASPKRHLELKPHAPLPRVSLASDTCPTETAGLQENLEPPPATVLELEIDDTQQPGTIHQACSPPLAAVPKPDADQHHHGTHFDSKLDPPPLAAAAAISDDAEGTERVSLASHALDGLGPNSKVKDLHAKLQELQQPIYGTKAQLWKRLQQASLDKQQEDADLQRALEASRQQHDQESCSAAVPAARSQSLGPAALGGGLTDMEPLARQGQLPAVDKDVTVANKTAQRCSSCSSRKRKAIQSCEDKEAKRKPAEENTSATSGTLAVEPSMKLSVQALEAHNRQFAHAAQPRESGDGVEAAPVEVETKGAHTEEAVAMREAATAGAAQVEVEPQFELSFTQESQDADLAAGTSSTPLSKGGRMSRDEQNNIITSIHVRHLFKSFNPAWMKTKRREPSTPSLGSAYIQEHILSQKDITATPQGNTRTSVLSLKAPQVRKLRPPASWEISAEAASSGACGSDPNCDTNEIGPQPLTAPQAPTGDSVVACGSGAGQWKRGSAAVSHGSKLSDLLPSPVKRQASCTATDKNLKTSSLGSSYSDQQGAEVKSSPVRQVRHKARQDTDGARSMPSASIGPDDMLQSSQPEPEPMVTKGPRFVPTALEINARQQGIVKELGGTFGNDWSADVTHLVANTFRRTTKMMMAICKGIHVVTPDFLAQSAKAGRFLNEADYVLKDNVCEHCFAKKRGLPSYSLQDALALARQNGPLLKGISVYLFPDSQEQTKKEIESVVTAAGGTWLTRFPKHADDPSMLLIGERVKCDKMKERRSQHKVYDIELLREAALTQKLRKNMYLLQAPAEDEAKEKQQIVSSAK